MCVGCDWQRILILLNIERHPPLYNPIGLRLRHQRLRAPRYLVMFPMAAPFAVDRFIQFNQSQSVYGLQARPLGSRKAQAEAGHSFSTQLEIYD